LTGIKQNCVEGKFENPEERFRGNGHAMHAEAMSHLLPATPPPCQYKGAQKRNLSVYPYEYPTAVCRCVLVRAEWQLENFFNLKKFSVLCRSTKTKGGAIWFSGGCGKMGTTHALHLIRVQSLLQ